jgi:hypothetical protein
LNRLNIDETSGAFAKEMTYLIPLDILGNTRSTPPDLGAYQNKSFPKSYFSCEEHLFLYFSTTFPVNTWHTVIL